MPSTRKICSKWNQERITRAMTGTTAFAAPSVVRPLLQRAPPNVALCGNTLRSFAFSDCLPYATSQRFISRARMTATGPCRSKSTEQASQPAPPSPTPTYKIALLYDSDCPLCMKEVNFLQRRVEGQGPPPSIKFVDIASPDYQAADNAGIDYETAMGRIHGIKPNGAVLVGVPVFREAYEAVGLGWVYAVTKLPGVGALAESVYNVWAQFRLQLTGRPPLEEVMRLRRGKAEKTCR